MTAVGLFLEPSSPKLLGDHLFDVDSAAFAGDQLHAPYTHLKETLNAAGVAVHTSDRLSDPAFNDLEYKLYISIANLKHYEHLSTRDDITLSACFAMECPVVDPELYRGLDKAQRHFKRIYSWGDSESLARFINGSIAFEKFYWPQAYNDVHEETWAREDRGFLVIINSNKLPSVDWQELYTARLEAIAYFGERGEIDLYGQFWDQPSLRLGRTWIPWTLRALHRGYLSVIDRIKPDQRLAAARRVYRGRAASKRDTLGAYKFAICFENMISPGWITEKLFDCFYAGTVPVYWGAPEIGDLIPDTAFIDMRRFDSYDALRDYLLSLKQEEIDTYKRSARDFLRSAAFERFSKESFTKLIGGIVQEDAKVDLDLPGA